MNPTGGNLTEDLAYGAPTGFGAEGLQVFSDYNNQSGAVIRIATSAGGAGLTGFNWLAIGY